MIIGGDCIEVMARNRAECIDAIVTDPPYGLSEYKPAELTAMVAAWAAGEPYRKAGAGFMGKGWDSCVPGPDVWREAYRVLKPGGHLVAFAGPRTLDLMSLSIRIAGFEIRDTLAWLYGSGFPKSLNVSKAIDSGGGRPEDIRRMQLGEAYAPSGRGRVNYDHGAASAMNGARGEYEASPEARQWEGWGTALKPAYEPIVLARKPLIGTVAANVLQYGTGAINVDGCRIDGGGTASATDGKPSRLNAVYGDAMGGLPSVDAGMGRWPANVLMDEWIEPLVRLRYDAIASDSTVLSEWCDANRHDLYAMRAGVLSVPVALDERAREVLRETVLRAVAEREPQRSESPYGGAQALAGVDREDATGEGRKSSWGAEFGLEGRRVSGARLSDGSSIHASAGAPDDRGANDIEGERLPAGASAGDGAGTWSPAAPFRGGAPLQRDQDGQPLGEPRAADGCDPQADAPADRGGVEVAAGGERNAPRTDRLVPLCSVPREWWHHFEPVGVGLRLGAAAILDASVGTLTSGKMMPTHTEAARNTYGQNAVGGYTTMETYGDSGGPSRFFYVAKASRSERERGLTAPESGRANTHPTVKPVALMRWLVTLVTPPGGHVLDPFAGSGTTGIACAELGVRFTGIEKEPEYAAIARQRIEAAVCHARGDAGGDPS